MSFHLCGSQFTFSSARVTLLYFGYRHIQYVPSSQGKAFSHRAAAQRTIGANAKLSEPNGGGGREQAKNGNRRWLKKQEKSIRQEEEDAAEPKTEKKRQDIKRFFFSVGRKKKEKENLHLWQQRQNEAAKSFR